MSEQAPQFEIATPERPLSPQQVLAAGSELLRHFGVTINPAEQPTEFGEALIQLDPRYKKERTLVRFELEDDSTNWSEQDKAVAMTAAERLHILKPETPLVGEFDVVISMGAARQANLDRLRYAAAATKKGGSAHVGQLIAAGSARKLKEAEQHNTANYAPGAVDEFDLAAGAAKTVARETPGLVVGVVYVDNERASTSTVVETVLERLKAEGKLHTAMRLGAVTTQIYQPFTSIDVARVAKTYGIEQTFVAGNPSDPNIVAKRTPATYLSEVLRTLRAASESQAAEQLGLNHE
jgi:hypothetical protein